MEHGDLGGGGGEPLPEGGVHKPGPEQEQDEEQGRAQGVEQQVDQPRPAGVHPGGGGGHEGGDAGADVGAQDDIQHLVPPGADGQPRHRHGDDHRGGGGAGLHQRREEHPRQQEQEGIAHRLKQGLDRVPVGLHGVGHEGQPHEDQPQPRQDHARAPQAVPLAGHGHEYAGEGEDLHIGGDGKRAEGGDLGGDGGADVGPHDHGRRLVEVHHPHVDEAHDQHGGDAGALDQGGGRRPYPHVHQTLVGGFAEQILDPAGGQLLDVGGEQMHPHQKHPRPGQQPDEEQGKLRDVHLISSFL